MKVHLVLATALLSGCAPTLQQTDGAAAPSNAERAGARCDSGPIQDLIGKNADAVTADAKARSGAETVRRYVTGSPVTMDYRADRLNIETDTAGTIVRLGCG